MNTTATQPTTIRLTLDISYELNGESPDMLIQRLVECFDYCKGNGMLTGSTEAEVADYALSSNIRPAPLSEEELADFMRHRLENGEWADNEGVALRLARFGLMDPDDFTTEMRERMELAQAESE